MFWNKFFWPSFLVLVATAIFHYVACQNYYYETIAWYDILMHFLGGLWVYLFILWIAHTQYGKWLLPYTLRARLFILVLIVGFLWEIFELVLQFTDINDPRYATDTPLDLIMDLLGAFVGSMFYKK